jgi:hypothetical protein
MSEKDSEEEYCSSLGLCRCLMCDIVSFFIWLGKKITRFLRLERLRDRIHDFDIWFSFNYCVPYADPEEEKEILEELKDIDWEHLEFVPYEFDDIEEEEKKEKRD